MAVYKLTNDLVFPNPRVSETDGLLAVGGDLTPERLLLAYQNGIFPWYDEESPILWWSPDPRFVLFPNQVKVSKSMNQFIKKSRYRVTFNVAFDMVINACKNIKRTNQDGTWITAGITAGYGNLHKLGYAHSVEVWQNEELVAGLYGVAIGKCFFGESMFSKISNGSKLALIVLAKRLSQIGFEVIDCQVYTDHLKSLGAESIGRNEFLDILDANLGEDKLEKVVL